MTPDDMEAVASEWLAKKTATAIRALLLDYQERGRALERMQLESDPIKLRAIARASLKGKSQ